MPGALTDRGVTLDYIENVDLFQRGVFHLFKLLFGHLLSCYLNDFHRQLLTCLLVDASMHHTADTPEKDFGLFL